MIHVTQMIKPYFATQFIVITVAGSLPLVCHAAEVVKANNNNAPGLGTSWSGGTAPTSSDIAVFDSTYAQASGSTLVPTAALSWLGIKVTTFTSGANPVNIDNTTIANHVGIGSSGIDMSAAERNFRIFSAQVQASQTWNIASSRTLEIGVDRNGALPAGHKVTLAGAGTLRLIGGTVSLANTAASSIGLLETYSGTLNVTHDLSVAGKFSIGETGTAVFNHSAGTVSANSATGGFGNGLNIGHRIGGNGTYNLSGGTLNTSAAATLGAGGGVTGILNISAGTANLAGLILKTSDSSIATLNLTGGRLNLASGGITAGVADATNRNINLGGGTLGATANWSSTLGINLTGTNGNVTINTLDSVDNTTARTIALSGVLSSTGKLVKDGVGTLTLSNAGNTFSGNIEINGGILEGSGASGNTNTALGLSSGSRTVTVNNTGTLRLIGNNVFGNSTQALASTTKVVVNSGGAMTTSAYNVLGNIDLNGGTLTATGGSSSTYQAYEFNGSTITIGGSTASTISATGSNSGMHIAGTKTLTLNVGDAVAGAATDLTVSAALINGSNDRTGSGALTKNGAGTALLSGANLYTGATTVNGGTLRVDGSTAAGSAVAVNNAAILSGTGTVGGAVTLNSTASMQSSGTLSLTNGFTAAGSSNSITGGTIAGNGTVNVSTSLNLGSGSTVNGTVAVNGSLTGTGTVTGALSGSGSVDVGNSPGIMTVGTLNSANLDFNFEFGAANTTPVYSNAAASGNDVLRLTSATDPFTASLTNTNTITLYLGVTSLTLGDVFVGGFFTDKDEDFLASISNATFQYFLSDVDGATTYMNNKYSAYSGPLSFTAATVAVPSANFSGGTVDGYVSQFTVVPEPRIALLSALGVLALLRRKRN
jgi:autotransporter-associated beta strand protein